jgi:protocatechuate 3,4-dioxygenase beta subunit
MSSLIRPDRRQFLGAAALGAADLAAPGVFAEELFRTPAQTEGPFYPDHLPLDTDNDLIIVNTGLTAAVGTITHLSGKLLDAKGDPIRNAVVEIWQVDNRACYFHSRGANGKERDPHFQGYGRFLTGSTGEYYFRTIRPVPYPGRTPHIHFKIRKGGKELLTTQCYIAGEAANERDGVYRGLRDAKERSALSVPFVPVPGSRIGEQAAKFDLILGVTPEQA